MPTLRKATPDDLDFLIRADLCSDSDPHPPAEMTPEETGEHRVKIAAFVQDEEHKAAWVYEESPAQPPLGMILWRWRTRTPKQAEEAYHNDDLFQQLTDDLFPEDGRFCEIFQLWGEPAFRRRSLATGLKQHAETESRRRGVGMLYTHTAEQNRHVIELNQKLGYHIVRRGPIWDDVIRVSLIKRLDT